MDHLHASGAASGGNLTAVANSGGAGAAFDLAVSGTIPVTPPYVTLDPNNRFDIASRVELVDTRLFIVADILALTSNQNFFGRNVGGEVTNIFLNTAGDRMTVNRNPGTGFVNAQIDLAPAMAAALRLDEIKMTPGSNVTVWAPSSSAGRWRTPSPSVSTGSRRANP